MAHKVNLHLGDKKRSSFGYDFKGPASGGKILVDDVDEDTGTDQAGELKYNQPARKRSGEAALYLFRNTCMYVFQAGFQVPATYAGDPEVDPGPLVGFGINTFYMPIPHDLILNVGGRFTGANPQCLEFVQACAGITSGWMPDLVTLYECHSPDFIGNCANQDNPEFNTPVHFEWRLKPIFKKA